MKINEVESIVGLSKKSIRYYEEMGLIVPSRNKNNDYRVYNKNDIEKLKKIKFLRELDVPIKEIQELNDKKISLKSCMENRLSKIENEEEKYQKVRMMCQEIIELNEEFETIDISKYFQGVSKLNKEGFTMYNVKTNNKKKIIGAVLSSSVFGGILLLIIVLLVVGQIKDTFYLPMVIFLPLLIMLGLPLICIIYNLVIRIKEILGGEEDEASKY